MNTKRFVFALIGVLLLLVISFFAGRCSNDDEDSIKVPVTITVPSQSGHSGEITGIKPLPSKGRDSIMYKDSLIYVESPFNKELADRYNKMETDTEKLKEYLRTIQEHEYVVPFEDSLINITGTIKTRGELLSTKFDYTIKPREFKTIVDVPVKKSVFAIYAGAGLSNTVKLDNAAAFGNIGIQNKRGDIFSVQYGTDKTIQIGYSFRILDIKK